MLINANNFGAHQSMQRRRRSSCYAVMTVFSEVSMCLWWPGKTAAGQKWVSEDVSVFNSSCLDFEIPLSCF